MNNFKKFKLINYLAIFITGFLFTIFILFNVNSGLIDQTLPTSLLNDFVPVQIHNFVNFLSQVIDMINLYYIYILVVVIVIIIAVYGFGFFITGLVFKRVDNTEHENYIGLLLTTIIAILQLSLTFSLLSNFIIAAFVNQFQILLDLNLAFIIGLASFNLFISINEMVSQFRNSDFNLETFLSKTLKVITVVLVFIFALNIVTKSISYFAFLTLVKNFDFIVNISVTDLFNLNYDVAIGTFIPEFVLNYLPTIDLTMTLSDFGLSQLVVDAAAQSTVLVQIDQVLKTTFVSIVKPIILSGLTMDIILVVLGSVFGLFLNFKINELEAQTNIIIKLIIAIIELIIFFALVNAFYALFIEIFLIFIVLGYFYVLLKDNGTFKKMSSHVTKQ